MTAMLSALNVTVKHAEYINCNNVKMNLQERIKAAMIYAGAKQATIVSALKVSRAAVSMWVNGPTQEIKSKHAMQLAALLGVNPDWLAYGKGDMLGSAVTHDPGMSEYFAGQAVPLLSKVSAGEFCEKKGVYDRDDVEGWLPRPSNASDLAYGLMVDGDSMTSPYPNSRSYPHGMIIYVDPGKEVLPGMRGVFRLPDSDEVVFKELISDAGAQYLRPLNPQYEKIKVTEGVVTCGRVIGSYLPE
jgi:SOS-response transcriptional repressor LexA